MRSGRVGGHHPAVDAPDGERAAQQGLGDAAAGRRPGELDRQLLEVAPTGRGLLRLAPGALLAGVGVAPVERRRQPGGQVTEERLLDLVERLGVVEAGGEHAVAVPGRHDRQHRPHHRRRRRPVGEIARPATVGHRIDRVEHVGGQLVERLVTAVFESLPHEHHDIGLEQRHPVAAEAGDHVVRLHQPAEQAAELGRVLGRLEATGVVDRGADQRGELAQHRPVGIGPALTGLGIHREQCRAPEQLRRHRVARRVLRLVLALAPEHQPRVGGTEEAAGLQADLLPCARRASALRRSRGRRRTDHGANPPDRARSPTSAPRRTSRRRRRGPPTGTGPCRRGGRLPVRSPAPAGSRGGGRPAAGSTGSDGAPPARALWPRPTRRPPGRRGARRARRRTCR